MKGHREEFFLPKTLEKFEERWLPGLGKYPLKFMKGKCPRFPRMDFGGKKLSFIRRYLLPEEIKTHCLGVYEIGNRGFVVIEGDSCIESHFEIPINVSKKLFFELLRAEIQKLHEGTPRYQIDQNSPLSINDEGIIFWQKKTKIQNCGNIPMEYFEELLTVIDICTKYPWAVR